MAKENGNEQERCRKAYKLGKRPNIRLMAQILTNQPRTKNLFWNM